MEDNVSTKSDPKERTRAAVAKRERAAKARLCGGKATEEQIADRLSVTLSDKRSDHKQDTRAAWTPCWTPGRKTVTWPRCWTRWPKN